MLVIVFYNHSEYIMLLILMLVKSLIKAKMIVITKLIY